jgi:hypothetical protein
LAKVSHQVNDISTDFSDGTKLIMLLEVISSKQLGKYNPAPSNKLQKVDNLSKCFDFLRREKMRIENCGPQGRYLFIFELIRYRRCRWQCETDSWLILDVDFAIPNPPYHRYVFDPLWNLEWRFHCTTIIDDITKRLRILRAVSLYTG